MAQTHVHELCGMGVEIDAATKQKSNNVGKVVTMNAIITASKSQLLRCDCFATIILLRVIAAVNIRFVCDHAISVPLVPLYDGQLSLNSFVSASFSAEDIR